MNENGPVFQESLETHVHGMFTIQKSDHELTVPSEVDASTDHWSATLHFTVPYAKRRMKNPSTMFLRVSESIDIDLSTAGTMSR